MELASCDSANRCLSEFAHGREGGIERRIEAVTIEGLEETVATYEILEPGAHLGESHVDARSVEFPVELLEHPRRGHVNVGHRLALDDNPFGVALGDHVADLGTEG